MTFQELLLNLMGTHTSRKLKVVAKEWEGELLIKGNEVVRAEVHGAEKLEGIDALEFMFKNQTSIERVEFLPFEDSESNVRVDQMFLFNLVQEEQEKEEEIHRESPGKFLEVCRKYFSENHLRLVYCKGKVELSSGISSETFSELIQSYVERTKENDPCGLRKILLRFEKVFCLILFSGKNCGIIAADIEEYPNYELDQPLIDKELSEVLSG